MADSIVTERRCARCTVVKPAADFYKDRNRADGLQSYCKLCHSTEMKRRRALNICDTRAKSLESGRRLRRMHPIRYQGYVNKWRVTVRAEVIEHYSNGRNACECCGIDYTEFLCIDHINGGGNQHRREHGIKDLYRWLRGNAYPTGFRVLCQNCNAALGHYGYCPHEMVK